LGSESLTKATDFAGKMDGQATKAARNDSSKLPLHLVPGSLVRACARALEYGAKKYAPNNWRKGGLKFSELLSALDRHLQLLKDGEMIDQESGLHHLDHIAANTGFLSEYLERPEYAQYNDLFVRPSA
jgi:dATP/dGTP diphosphohydrolase